jgi:membrane protein implicated in regulation of membrane protease activity
MLDAFLQNEVWVWATIGAFLLVAELLTGTMYILWIAVAAFITTLIVAIFPNIGLTGEVIIFSLISVISVFGGRKLFPPPSKTVNEDINNPNIRLIGQMVIVTEDFVGGIGAVKHGDTRWRASSAISPKSGEALKVVAVDGATLIVEPVK